MSELILTINLGTGSTRVALFDGETKKDEKNLEHDAKELESLNQEQHTEKRCGLIADWLKENGVSAKDLGAIALRIANLPKSIKSGTVKIEGALRDELDAKYKPDSFLSHGTDISLSIADKLLDGADVPCFVVEPANQNDMIDVARISGHSMFERTTIFHALNEKAVARLEAEELGKAYEDCSFITVHMGGGISVSLHQKGRITDTNNCGGEEGCFSGTRTGTLPALRLVQMCYSGKFTIEQMYGVLLYKGGVASYLGTGDMREVEKMMADGDEKADLIFRAMAYRTAKEIGALATIADDKIDKIILTGGISNSKKMCELITGYVEKFAPVSIYAGERESESLAASALRILRGEETPTEYPA